MFKTILLLAGLIAVTNLMPLFALESDSTHLPDTSIITKQSLVTDASDTALIPPVLTRFVKADYPAAELAQGVEGVVIMDLQIDTLGQVCKVDIINGINPNLDSAAKNAALRFQFQPARIDSMPIAVVLQYAYRFSIEEQIVDIKEQVNCQGVVLEKGTKTPMPSIFVAITIGDSNTDSSLKHAQSPQIVNGIPMLNYFKKIGKIPGQKFEDNQLIAATDSAGRFKFTSLPTGTFKLIIIAPGFKPFFSEVTVAPVTRADLTLYLTKQNYNEYEIVVYGKSVQPEVAYHSLTGQEIRHLPGFNGEAVKVVLALPGVARPVLGGNELVIRGANASDNRIVFDGISLPYLYHEVSDFSLYRTIINSDVLSSVSLLPGSAGVRYGNMVGGVIELAGRQARTDRWHFSLDANLLGYSLLFESPLLKNLSIIGSFRGSLDEYTLEIIQRIRNSPVEPAQEKYLDFSLRFDYSLMKSHKIFIEAIGAQDTIARMPTAWQISRGLAGDEIAYTSGRKFLQGIAGWDWFINDNRTNSFRLGVRRQYSTSIDRDFAFGGQPLEMDGHENTFDLRNEYSEKFSTNVTLKGGCDVHITPLKSGWKQNGIDTTYADTTDLVRGQTGFYLSASWNGINKLTITPGLRYDWYPAIRYRGALIPEFWNYDSFDNTTHFSGDPALRLAARYDLDQLCSFTASMGTYSQCPGLDAIWYSSPDSLTSIKGSQFSIGYSRQLTNAIFSSIDAYYNQQWDMFRFTTAAERQSVPVVDQVFGKFNGKARMVGLEFLIRHQQTRQFSGWLSYSLSYAERFDFAQQKWYRYDYNILNNIQVVGQFALPLENNVGVRLQYTDGYPYTPYYTRYYDATHFHYQAIAGQKNSMQYPSYVGLDLNYAKKWVFKKSVLTTYVEFIRILHALQYVKDSSGKPLYLPTEAYGYNYDYSALEGFAMIPMISFGLTWEF